MEVGNFVICIKDIGYISKGDKYKIKSCLNYWETDGIDKGPHVMIEGCGAIFELKKFKEHFKLYG